MSSSSTIHGIDLFAGAGGLSLGAKLAGVRVVQAIENNRAAAETYRRNHPETEFMEQSVCAVAPKTVGRGRLILFGGPPCQGFSSSNQRTRNLANAKNWLFGELFRFARVLQPEYIVLENVKGLQDTLRGHFARLIQAEFEALNYRWALWTLNAAEFGVPQRRTRLFFIGRRRGNLPPPPQPTGKPAITLRQAIGDLPPLEMGASVDVQAYSALKPSAYARMMRNGSSDCTGHLVTKNSTLIVERYRHIPPGGNWWNIPKRLMRNYTNLVNNRSRHTGIYRRLIWDEPSIVIANFRKNMLVHPDQHRGLSVREAARIQSFPDDYVFAGSIGLQQQQVSNAVPPLLAKAVFLQLIKHM